VDPLLQNVLNFKDLSCRTEFVVESVPGLFTRAFLVQLRVTECGHLLQKLFEENRVFFFLFQIAKLLLEEQLVVDGALQSLVRPLGCLE